MKRLLYLGLAIFLAMPAAMAKKHTNDHSNKGGSARGLTRASDVQAANAKADSNRGFTVAPGIATAMSKQASHKTH